MSATEELTLWSAVARDHGTSRTLVDPEARDWQDNAEAIIERLAAEGVDFDASDVAREAGPAPSPGAMGAVFLRAAKAKVIEPVGVRRSSAISRHRGLVRVWRGVP